MARKPAAAVKLPAYEVETWPVDRLQPYERNTRKHPKDQIETLRKSIRKYGQVWPLLVREDGTVIAGHGRLEAVKAEGLEEVRVIVARGWTAAQCRAFGIMDNKVALNAEWDMEALSFELGELSEEEGGLDDLGFTLEELGDILSPSDEAETSRAPGGSLGEAVIQFNIVFDDEAQQQRWFAFVRELKTTYPDAETLGERLSLFLEARR